MNIAKMIAAGVLGGGAAPSPLRTGLIAYWKMDEASDGSAAVVRVDATGNGHNASDSTQCVSEAGKLGNAAVIAVASNKRLIVTPHADLASGDIDFMWCGWVKWNTVVDAKSVLAKWNTIGDKREYRFGYNYAANGKISFYVSPTGTSTAVGVHCIELGTPEAGTWYFFCVWHDSVNNVIGIQINNGTEYTAAATGVYNGDAYIGFGADINSAGASYASYADISVDSIGRWNRILTADERTALYNGGSGNAYPFDVATIAKQVIFDGDSMTDGRFSVYPYITYGLLSGVNVYYNFGVSGQTAAQMAADASTQIVPLYKSGRDNIVVLWGGTNDLFTVGTAGADVFASIVSECTALKAAGYQTVVLTITKRNDAKYTEAKEAQRVILNGLINAGNENIDLVCDAAGLAHLQDPSDVTYFLDGLHLTAAGYADVASLVATGILTL